MHISAPLCAMLGLLGRRGSRVPQLVDASVLCDPHIDLPDRVGGGADIPSGHDPRYFREPASALRVDFDKVRNKTSVS